MTHIWIWTHSLLNTSFSCRSQYHRRLTPPNSSSGQKSHPVVQMYQQKDQSCTREGLQNQLCVRYVREYLRESAFWNCTGRIKYSLGQTGICSSVCNTPSIAILSLDNRKERITSSSIFYVSSTMECMHGAEASVHSKVTRNSRWMLLLLHSLGYQRYYFLRLCN